MSVKNTMPVRLYGNSLEIEHDLGLDEFTSRKIAAIIIYCGNIEYQLERAIWKLKGIDPTGIRPVTDSKNITDLINMFEACTPTSNVDYTPHWMKTWSIAAKSGYIIRNNIVHGVSNTLGDPIWFMRNPRHHGEVRKRDFGDFWCDRSTLEMIADSFATLLRLITGLAQTEKSLEEIGDPRAVTAVKEARSILGEFASQDYNPSFEKY